MNFNISVYIKNCDMCETKRIIKRIIIFVDDNNKKIKTEFIPHNERTQGFDILKDKNKIERTLEKTKLCTYGENCKRGSKCRFAHSKEELIVSNCVFGNSCRFVKKEQNGLSNISKTKICLHKHQDESMDNFYERIGFNKLHVKIIQ